MTERFLLSILRDADVVESVSNPQCEMFGFKNNVFKASVKLIQRFHETMRTERRKIPDRKTVVSVFKEYMALTAGDALLCMLVSSCKLVFAESTHELRRSGVLGKYTKMLVQDEETLAILDFVGIGTGLKEVG